MHHAIKDRIGDGRVGEEVVPIIGRVLARYQEGPSPHAPIDYRITCDLGAHLTDSEVVQHQKARFCQLQLQLQLQLRERAMVDRNPDL